MRKVVIFTAVLFLLCAGCTEKVETPPSVSPTQTAAVVSTITPMPTPTPAPTPELPRVWRDDPLPAAALSVLEVPGDGRVWDWISSDLNGDGLEDLAVVTEAPPVEDDENPIAMRTLTILLGAQDGYKLGQQNDRFIGRANEGGGWGDPYEGMLIDEENRLHVGEYGGGWNRWGKDYCFFWDGEGLVLASFTYEVSFPTKEWVHVQTEHYDYARQTYERWGDEKISLFTCELDSICLPLEEISERIEDPALYLPERDSNEAFVPPDVGTPILSASEALNRIHNQYYPKLSKVNIPWTEETYQSYTDWLGYAPPRYYYSDGEFFLYFYSTNYQGESYEHSIFYRDVDWDVSELYRMADDTGEVEHY